MSEEKLNHVAWARSMIGFIRERGLEGEFKDWCGGWPCGVASPDASPPAKPAPADALALLKCWVEWSCGQQGPSPFHDTRAFLSTTPEQR